MSKARSSKNYRTPRNGAPRKLRLAELDNDDWLDDEDQLPVHEKALLEARLAAYAKDPDAGSTWQEVEDRIRTRILPGRTNHPTPRLRQVIGFFETRGRSSYHTCVVPCIPLYMWARIDWRKPL